MTNIQTNVVKILHENKEFRKDIEKLKASIKVNDQILAAVNKENEELEQEFDTETPRPSGQSPQIENKIENFASSVDI